LIPPFRTCLITASERYGTERTLEVVAAAASAGVEAVQVRERHLSARDLNALVERVIEAARPTGMKVMVNGRLDVALTVGADGVHLGGDALHPEAARELADRIGVDRFIVGASAHDLAEVARASAGGVDYVLFGPIYASPPKADEARALGHRPLSEVCAEGWVPVLALGGITAANTPQVMGSGAHGTAVIRALFDVDDPEVAAREWVSAHDFPATRTT